jgi:putative nucleotidyltransferase with HDIG domain
VTPEHFVLIVSDRPDEARLLARGMKKVVACRTVGPAAPMPAQPPLVVIADLADETEATVWLSRLKDLRLPCLHIARAPQADDAHPPGATRTLPVDATRPAILSALFDLIDALQQARIQRARQSVRASLVQGLAGQANVVIGGAFEAAQAGRPIDPAEIESGTEVILEAISECGIRSWLETINRHDEQLYQHSLSVAGFASAFGLQLQLSRADQMRLAKAALLHDLGKANIPRAILNKPGKLTAEEMAIMRTHPGAGADILARQGGFDATLLAVVRHHHEMLDGTGYPDGLSGDRIPDLVRLVTICDIHSALTERRAYRDPLPHDEAHAIMRRMSNKLDGSLLRAFSPIVLRSAGYALAD